MSATPDWAGQVYKDTGTGNIWKANSTTPGDWSLEVQNFKIEWEPRTVDLPSMMGYFTYGDFPGVTKIIFGGTSSLSGFDIESLSSLVEIGFPNLVSIDPTNTQGGFLTLYSNPLLATLSLPVLATMAGDFRFKYSNAITSISLPLLNTVGKSIIIDGNPLLASVSIPSLVSLGRDCILTGNALSASSLEHVLHILVSLAGYSGNLIDLSGGTNAGLSSLSAQGQADYATLGGSNVTAINP